MNLDSKTRDDTLSIWKEHTTDSVVQEDSHSNIKISKIDPQDPIQKAQIQENAMKILKQHLEITKLKEEVESTKKEKEELEEEISNRSKEIYEMNERILLMEMNHANNRQEDLTTIQDLKLALEQNQNSNKLSYDFSKFIDSLERLKADLEILKLSEKFSKNRNKKHFENSEEFLGDNLNIERSKNNDTLEDSDNSSRNISSDNLVLENIQKMIDLIQWIQEEIKEQENNKNLKTNANDTENTTTIMQDIDIINRAVSDNVVTSEQDSFLNSMCEDGNISKFEENTVKYSVSASTLEEKEAEINDLKQFIEAQKKMMDEVAQNNQNLIEENKKFHTKLEENNSEKNKNEKPKQDSKTIALI